MKSEFNAFPFLLTYSAILTVGFFAVRKIKFACIGWMHPADIFQVEDKFGLKFSMFGDDSEDMESMEVCTTGLQSASALSNKS